MKKLFLILSLSIAFCFIACKKKELKDGYAKITFNANVDFKQDSCKWGAGSYVSFTHAILIEIIEPSMGLITVHAIYKNGHQIIEIEMGPGSFPNYANTEDEDEWGAHIKVGHTYEWRISIICTCHQGCPPEFVKIKWREKYDPCYILASGTIIPKEKDEDNIIEVDLIYN